jgi:hypothetical protein
MSKVFFTLLFTLFTTVLHAVPKYWVGQLNGNWNDAANWSLSEGGPGSAGVPGSTDSVIFAGSASVNINTSPTIAALTVTSGGYNVALYTATSITFTILKNLRVDLGSVLTDSTSAAVRFNMTIDANNGGRATIQGRWEFVGAVPVAGSSGAYFSAGPGALVTVGNNTNTGTPTIACKSNSGSIASFPPSLVFTHYSNFLVVDNANPVIPSAIWAGVEASTSGPIYPDLPGSLITVQGNCGNIRHSYASPYGSIKVDLATQQTNVNLGLQHDMLINGNLYIANTNSKTLTLLSNNVDRGTNLNIVRIRQMGLTEGGDLTITGANTLVALSTPTTGGPAITYRLDVYGSFNQSGGNFSLQDNDSPGGSATLGLKYALNQTAGTFITNTTAIKPLIVEMFGPIYFNRPGGYRNFGQFINMSSGSIDNAQHTVTLRIAQNLPAGYIDTKQEKDLGVVLQKPLAVGGLQMVRGTLTSSSASLLTVHNPSPTAISQGTDSSYIIGPFEFSTASTSPYLIPTGSEPTYYGGFYGLSYTVFHKDGMMITPSSATPSTFRTRYFASTYPDSVNLARPLLGIAKNKYWDITKVSGGDATVRLTLNDSITGSSSDKALVVAHYENGQWVAANGTVLSPGNVKTGFVTSKLLSSFSPFTFGIINGNQVLAINFTGFTARKTEEGATLNWSVESAPAKFEIMRSADGTSYASIGILQADNLQNSYQFIDKNILPGTNYYRIKSIEPNGNTGLSVTRSVLNSALAFSLNHLAPNQVRASASLSLTTQMAGKIALFISDHSGRTLKRLDIEVRKGTSEQTITVGDLPVGIYHIAAYANGTFTNPIRFTKIN